MKSPRWYRFAKVTAGCVALLLGALPLFRATVLTVSRRAAVNAKTVVITSPIEGVVDFERLAVGRIVESGQSLLRLTNSRADDRHLAEIQAEIEVLRAQIHARSDYVQELSRLGQSAGASNGRYRQVRRRQLTARVAEAKARLDAEKLKQENAAKALARLVQLTAEGIATESELDAARTTSKVAEQAVAVAVESLRASEVNLEAVNSGMLLDSGGSDTSYAQQRGDQLELEHSQESAHLSETEARLKALNIRLEAERARVERLRGAEIKAPVRARIWKQTVGDGAFVPPGQSLLELMDCEAVFVTAIVSETSFNRLSIGAPAYFKVKRTGEVINAKIAQLVGAVWWDGAIAVPLNSGPRTKNSDARYGVVLALEDAGGVGKRCQVGETGELLFGDRFRKIWEWTTF